MSWIPKTEHAPVLRTDFADDTAWQLVSALIAEPAGGFRAYVSLVSDARFDGLSPEQLLSRITERYEHTFIFIADRFTLTHAEHPLLVMDLFEERGRTFRVIPSEMWSVENNLSIGNMDFAEFADSTDPDGFFRGFPHP